MNKVKFLGTTNPRFVHLVGTIDDSYFFGTSVFWFGDFHTSYLIECKIKERIMILKTRNSEYIFELLGVTTYNEFKLNEEEIIEMEKLC